MCGLKLMPAQTGLPQLQIILPCFSEIDIFITFLRIEYDLCMYTVVGSVSVEKFAGNKLCGENLV